MKEKFKAIIEKVEESKKGSRVIESMVRYTYATNVTDAQRNIVYHLSNDDKIYLGIDQSVSTTDKIVRWEIARIDLERNFEQLALKVGVRGKDTKPRHRRTRAEIENDRDYTKIEFEIKKDVYNTLKTYLEAINLNEKEFLNEIIERELKGKEEALKELDEIMKKLRGDK